MDYRVDTHFGSGPVVYALDAQRLIVSHEKSGERRVLPYSSVKKINLRQDMPGAFTTVIAHDEGRAVMIPSRHFVGIGRFESRATEYVAFVTELHRLAHAASPSIRFVVGSSLLFWAGVAVASLGGLLGVLVVVGMATTGRMPPAQAIWPVPMAIFVSLGFLRQGRAKLYDPQQLPETMLPRE